MPYFQKKPVVIEAIYFHGDNKDQIQYWSRGEVIPTDDGMSIKTLEGVMDVRVGDWVIRGIKGEFYPCKNDIFQATYDFHGDPDSM